VGLPFSVSPEALERLKAQFERKGSPESFVRIGVKGGGCSGLEYVIKFDDRATPFDIEADLDGLRVVSDTRSAKYLAGATLVWTGNLLGGFQFDNPNADRQCGCGTSFTPKRAG
jgi:iron-sulfur cluster assembly protein